MYNIIYWSLVVTEKIRYILNIQPERTSQSNYVCPVEHLAAFKKNEKKKKSLYTKRNKLKNGIRLRPVCPMCYDLCR